MAQKDVTLAKQWIDNADRFLITASNGLSISEGLNLFADDQKLHQVLGDMADKYHIPNLLTALSFPYKNHMDYWRVISRIAEKYNYNYETSSYMKQIKQIIGNKPYFVWTSNIDHHFSQAKFNNIWEIEGNWLEGICSQHPDSHGKYNLKEKLHEIYRKDQNQTLTEGDLPVCDECGADLVLNIAGKDFQIDKNQVSAFRQFLAESENENLVVLELGIGPNNQMIKAPTMQLIASLPKSRYITVNKGELNIHPSISSQSIGFSATIGEALNEIISGESFGAKTEGPKKQKAPTPEQLQEQEKMLQKFYPNYMIDEDFHGRIPIYMTVDSDHPAYWHGLERGQTIMYSMGDGAIVHCFTPDGKYHKIKLGLNKDLGEEHGAYIYPGTIFAIELASEQTSGFSQLTVNLQSSDNSKILLPKLDSLLNLFPEQKELINRLAGD